ncbi:MAG: hypothetical protein E6L04_07365 [Thaumarchaeota archaeon]|nr:MAG: hypothetical protein E6L04_07365 [Nitrososphaerota archaeon]
MTKYTIIAKSNEGESIKRTTTNREKAKNIRDEFARLVIDGKIRSVTTNPNIETRKFSKKDREMVRFLELGGVKSMEQKK